MKFDHLGVFVKDLTQGLNELKKIIKIDSKSKIFNDPLLNVSVQFCYDNSGLCYELVAPFGDKNPVDGPLKSGNNILNHIAYKTNEFDETIISLIDSGFIAITKPQPAVAFEGARVIFFLTPLKLILELIEEEHE